MEKQDFNRLMEAYIDSIAGTRPELLLHSCCAPCTSSVLERLYPFFCVTLYYYNPNIHPEEEYYRRAAELPKLLRAAGMEDVKIIVPDYGEAEFYSAAAGHEAEPEGGLRCTDCFNLRLGETARKARELGIGLFCSTLSVSPHKNAALINEIGFRLAENGGLSWLPNDFKKKNGYLRSIELSREYGLYRQDYCGCAFSMRG